jgi:hypothetical protein
MKAIKVSTDERRRARLAGFKKKKPKKPKSKTEASCIRYIERYNNWAKELKAKAKEGAKLDNLRKEVASI